MATETIWIIEWRTIADNGAEWTIRESAPFINKGDAYGEAMKLNSLSIHTMYSVVPYDRRKEPQK
jgi:hypothetical protein